jgi:hypothetical protein
VEFARMKYPSRLSHTIRIGQDAAFHIGGLQRVSSIGSAVPIRRKSSPTMESTRCWERCLWMGTVWTSITRQRRWNSRR